MCSYDIFLLGSYDLFSSPPTGTPSKGINAIWDKLYNVDNTSKDVENLNGSSKIVETVNKLKDVHFDIDSVHEVDADIKFRIYMNYKGWYSGSKDFG